MLALPCLAQSSLRLCPRVPKLSPARPSSERVRRDRKGYPLEIATAQPAAVGRSAGAIPSVAGAVSVGHAHAARPHAAYAQPISSAPSAASRRTTHPRSVGASPARVPACPAAARASAASRPAAGRSARSARSSPTCRSRAAESSATASVAGWLAGWFGGRPLCRGWLVGEGWQQLAAEAFARSLLRRKTRAGGRGVSYAGAHAVRGRTDGRHTAAGAQPCWYLPTGVSHSVRLQRFPSLGEILRGAYSRAGGSRIKIFLEVESAAANSPTRQRSVRRETK